jgi:hypothetical protein
VELKLVAGSPKPGRRLLTRKAPVHVAEHGPAQEQELELEQEQEQEHSVRLSFDMLSNKTRP